jgi:hypothetical protein
MSFTVVRCLPVAHNTTRVSGLVWAVWLALRPTRWLRCTSVPSPPRRYNPLQRAARAPMKPRLLGVAVSNAYLGCSCVLRESLESLLCSNLATYYKICRQIRILDVL